MCIRDSYNTYRLTGERVASRCMISGTGLMNIHTREYDDEILKMAGIARSQLSRLTESNHTCLLYTSPEMGRFYRHVLIEGGYPHHGAVAFGHHGKTLFEVFKYIGVPVEEIGYNQPAGVRYPTENPWR